MSERPSAPQNDLVLRVTVPAAGELRSVAAELAARIAEFMGTTATGTEPVRDALEGLAARVARPGGDAQIEFEFSRAAEGLLITARSGSQTAELRYPLPS